MTTSQKMTMSLKVQPLVSLNPYQAIWKVRVLLTSKSIMCTYHNAKGEGCLFNVELTDEDGTQMQATMFNEAARKFYDKFEIGKVYYISKGTIKVANKQFRTLDNEYEMTLSQYSRVEEAINETMLVPERRFNFVPLDQLGPYINQKDLVDVIGVVRHVSSITTIRRKRDQQEIPKRDITIVDDTKKSVVVSLWNDHATYVGQDLLDMADKFPVLAMKGIKVGDFQGLSLSALPNSYIRTNPDIPQCLKLRSWFDSEGKDFALASIGSCINLSMKTKGPSMSSDRVMLDYITTNPSLGEDKPVFFNTRACMSFINPDQPFSYRACNKCNKKVSESIDSGYWCERCEKNEESCKLRYIVSAKFCDASGEAWFSIFNEEAETLFGCSADELAKIKSEEEGAGFQLQLNKAKWIPFLFRVGVSTTEYKNVKRQKINVIGITPIDFAADASFLLEDISLMNT